MFRSLAAVLVFVFVFVFVLVLSAACEAPANQAPANKAPQADRDAPASDPPIAASMRAAMAEMFAYSEGVFAIVREHRNHCDAMAARLAEMAPTFRELAPRMMAIKDQMKSLPEAQREALKQESEREAERFRTRVPDLDELERIAKQCEKSSPAFARVAPQVMFSKKK